MFGVSRKRSGRRRDSILKVPSEGSRHRTHGSQSPRSRQQFFNFLQESILRVMRVARHYLAVQVVAIKQALRTETSRRRATCGAIEQSPPGTWRNCLACAFDCLRPWRHSHWPVHYGILSPVISSVAHISGILSVPPSGINLLSCVFAATLPHPDCDRIPSQIASCG